MDRNTLLDNLTENVRLLVAIRNWFLR